MCDTFHFLSHQPSMYIHFHTCSRYSGVKTLFILAIIGMRNEKTFNYSQHKQKLKDGFLVTNILFNADLA